MKYNIITEVKVRINRVDSILLVPNTDRIKRAWLCFSGTYCPIIECLVAQHKTPTPQKGIDKEIVLQPLWE